MKTRNTFLYPLQPVRGVSCEYLYDDIKKKTQRLFWVRFNENWVSTHSSPFMWGDNSRETRCIFVRSRSIDIFVSRCEHAWTCIFCGAAFLISAASVEVSGTRHTWNDVRRRWPPGRRITLAIRPVVGIHRQSSSKEWRYWCLCSRHVGSFCPSFLKHKAHLVLLGSGKRYEQWGNRCGTLVSTS